jgi:hypothetical protein
MQINIVEYKKAKPTRELGRSQAFPHWLTDPKILL